MEIAANIKTAPIQSASHDAYASGKGPVPVHRRRHYFLPGCCACFPSFLLHRGRVIALARSPIATRAVMQSLLCGRTLPSWPFQISPAGCWMARENEKATAQGSRDLNLNFTSWRGRTRQAARIVKAPSLLWYLRPMLRRRVLPRHFPS